MKLARGLSQNVKQETRRLCKFGRIQMMKTSKKQLEKVTAKKSLVEEGRNVKMWRLRQNVATKRKWHERWYPTVLLTFKLKYNNSKHVS